MRRALLILMSATACEFTHGTPATTDARIDTAPDAPEPWTIDRASGKATPANAEEWDELIRANGLSMEPPSALWSMQETSGNLADQIGNASLKPNGSPMYAQAVPGWTRVGIGTSDGSIGDRFFNTTDPMLPDVGSASITILLYYATISAPLQTRNILFAGCCSAAALAHVDVTSAQQLSLTVATTTVTGTKMYGTEVVAIILQLDRTNGVQRVITDRETIDAPHTSLSSSKGIFVGSAGAPAPDGRWLYMAAWYGSDAEIDKSTLDGLVTALGW